MKKSSKILLFGLIVGVFMLTLAMNFYLYSLNRQVHQKVLVVESQLKIQNRYTDMMDFAYNFMSRLTSEILFDEPKYYQKHLTTNVFDLLKSNKDWVKTVLHYSISGVTISNNGQSVLKAHITFINKLDKEQTFVVYLYIEGETGQFIITHIKDHDIKNPSIHQEA